MKTKWVHTTHFVFFYNFKRHIIDVRNYSLTYKLIMEVKIMSKKNLIISFLLIQMVLNGIYVYLNAMVLQWTTGALNGEVSLMFLGGIFAIQTILSFGVSFFRVGRNYHHCTLSAMVLEKVNELE